MANAVVGHIKTTKAIEEKIAEYEIAAS